MVRFFWAISVLANCCLFALVKAALWWPVAVIYHLAALVLNNVFSFKSVWVMCCTWWQDTYDYDLVFEKPKSHVHSSVLTCPDAITYRWVGALWNRCLFSGECWYVTGSKGAALKISTASLFTFISSSGIINFRPVLLFQPCPWLYLEVFTLPLCDFYELALTHWSCLLSFKLMVD